jgi:hypothetical protein
MEVAAARQVLEAGRTSTRDRDAAPIGFEIAERNADLHVKIDRLRATMDREIEAAALVAEVVR